MLADVLWIDSICIYVCAVDNEKKEKSNKKENEIQCYLTKSSSKLIFIN